MPARFAEERYAAPPTRPRPTALRPKSPVGHAPLHIRRPFRGEAPPSRKLTTPDRLTYVGHATVLLELGGARLLTDPLLRGRVGPLRRHGPAPGPEVTADLDAVLITHPHHDHLDLPSLRGLDPTTPVLAAVGAARILKRRGFSVVSELGPGDWTRIGEVRIAAVEARHPGGRWTSSARPAAIGFELTAGIRAYFAGDTDLFEGMAALAGGLDLALLPVWGWGPRLGPGHLDPERAARAAALLSPRIAVPIHWGTFFPVGLDRLVSWQLRSPPRQFTRWAAALAPQVEVRVLAPGATTSLSA